MLLPLDYVGEDVGVALPLDFFEVPELDVDLTQPLDRAGEDSGRHQLRRLVQLDERVAERLAHEMLALHRLAELAQRRCQSGGFPLQPHLHVDDVESGLIDQRERLGDRVRRGPGAGCRLEQLVELFPRKARRIRPASTRPAERTSTDGR